MTSFFRNSLVRCARSLRPQTVHQNFRPRPSLNKHFVSGLSTISASVGRRRGAAFAGVAASLALAPGISLCSKFSTSFPEGNTEIVHIMGPDDANIAGNVHGGTIMKHIEQAGWIAATRHANSGPHGSNSAPALGALARLEHMDFWQPMFIGEVAKFRARVTYTSERSMQVVVDVFAENIRDGTERHTNRATLWYVAFPDLSTGRGQFTTRPMAVPPLPPHAAPSPEETAAAEAARMQRKAELAAAAASSGGEEGATCNDGSCGLPPGSPSGGATVRHSPASSTARLVHLMHPSDGTREGLVWAGTVMKLMDNAAGMAAATHCHTNVVTASVDTVDFLNPIRVGEAVHVVATPVYTSRKSMEIEVVVSTESLMPTQPGGSEGSEQGAFQRTCRLSDTAYFTFVSLDAEGRPRDMPPLLPQTAEEVEKYAAAAKRYNRRKQARLAKKKLKQQQQEEKEQQEKQQAAPAQ